MFFDNFLKIFIILFIKQLFFTYMVVTYHVDELYECQTKLYIDFFGHVLDGPDQFIVTSEKISNQTLLVFWTPATLKINKTQMSANCYLFYNQNDLLNHLKSYIPMVKYTLVWRGLLIILSVYLLILLLFVFILLKVNGKKKIKYKN